uniref:HPS3 biosis of lysosomal organelles complex 2 subunit 1 n=1 Tax=Leptobrachium leishanense TaxID=445787 RepID=A0A8C5M6Y3_9ANUR
MVQLYNCHPYGSQRIVPTKQVPEVFCSGRDCVFVTCAGGCKVEVFTVCKDLCQPLCSFNTLGKVIHMKYCDIGDYLVTIEEKNNVSSLRTYVNWRCQATGSSRVSVRMVGISKESLHSASARDQMEIIEMPLSEPPLCLACCPMRGDLLVGCRTKLIVFSLRYLVLLQDEPVLDFDRSLVLHVVGIVPSHITFCAGYIGISAELEVMIFKLMSEAYELPVAASPKPKGLEVLPEKDLLQSNTSELDDFVMCLRPVELVGEECKSCNIVVTPESIGLSADIASPFQVHHILYRRFAPDYTEGLSVENLRLHSLQLMPFYKTGSLIVADGKTASPKKEVLSLFCFFSMPHTGYLYSVGNTIQLVSVYRYPERSQQAILTPQLLHVITSNNLQCFTVRCSAAAARDEDPYIDTVMKTCPPVSLNICALRMQLFIGLKAIDHFKNYIIILTKADMEDVAGKGRSPRTPQSRRTVSVRSKTPAETESGWNLYVVSTMSTIQIYSELVEYSKRYDTMKTQGSIHLLSEAHLLVRATLMAPDSDELTDKDELLAAFKGSCASLGLCFSMLDTKHSHLALPYFKMSCLSVSEVLQRVLSSEPNPDYGKGFLFYLKHTLYEELEEPPNQDMALKVLQIFNKSEPSQLPHVLCSSCMTNMCPKKAIEYLQKLEGGSPSVLISLTKAFMALRMQDAELCEKEMQQHPEMLLLCGLVEEPRLLVGHGMKEILPTHMAYYFREAHPGLLVASAVALYENRKINLKEAEMLFKVLCGKEDEEDAIPQMLIDFWEALLSTYPPDSILQDILYKLSSHYVFQLCKPQHVCVRPLKSPEDLSLLCGPSMDIASFVPFLKFIPDDNNHNLSIHLLCKTRMMDYENTMERLLDRCPEAVMEYARHEIKDGSQALWWSKLLPELCHRIRQSESESKFFISCLRDTLEVIKDELELQDFLNVLPDDGTALFFLPYLLSKNDRMIDI